MLVKSTPDNFDPTILKLEIPPKNLDLKKWANGPVKYLQKYDANFELKTKIYKNRLYIE